MSCILVWNGEYVDYGDGPEEVYITWIDYIWSIQPKPGTVPAKDNQGSSSNSGTNQMNR